MRFNTVLGYAILREMAMADLTSVLAIEHRSQTHPWKKSHFIASIQAPAHCARVLVDEKISSHILGYYIFSTAADEAELLNIAIRPEIRGQGLGGQLLRYLCEQFDQRVEMLFLEVNESNIPAISLYCSVGFNEIGKYQGYYPARGKIQQKTEDALIFAKQLASY
ncbi:MAG: ribosomal-protein-alanine N-acetyltransferase [Cellvibrionaceae bacterium]|jgi:ribosomal-protein-alanine N-acetyltransferase